MIEVELKAYIQDLETTRQKLNQLARFVRDFNKSDRYYLGCSYHPEKDRQGFRLRSDGNTAFVTFKIKHIQSGIETNRETEFTVSDEVSFLNLISRLDCEEHYTKHKSGSAWEYEGCTIELYFVPELNKNFIEIEMLCDTNESAEETKKHLLSVLAKLDVSEEAIEPRPFSQMLGFY
jgi:predicted adenylyl cyclase CyaB